MQNADGTVDVTFESLSPIAFVVDNQESEENNALDTAAPVSPQTSDNGQAPIGRDLCRRPRLRGGLYGRDSVEEVWPQLRMKLRMDMRVLKARGGSASRFAGDFSRGASASVLGEESGTGGCP